MMRSTANRPGLSLTEVLVALFVMALGIISLMTLFPLGAMQMSVALRDDRSGQTASQADGMTRIWWQTQVVERPGTEDAFFGAMDNPGAPLPAKALDNNPSYPVFLDAIGWHSRSAGQREWMTGSTEVRIPRRSAAIVPNLTASIRACSMMDDITFAQTGQPDTASGSAGGVVREGAFNWCAVIQRPNNANRYVADLKILVFHTKGLYGGHVPGTNPAGAETIYSTAAGQVAAANAGSTQIRLNIDITNLPLRGSSWIMDGSSANVANFYRIQSITELPPLPGPVPQTILELDTPLKSNVTQLYVLRGLADVFDRPQLTNSGYHRQAP